MQGTTNQNFRTLRRGLGFSIKLYFHEMHARNIIFINFSYNIAGCFV